MRPDRDAARVAAPAGSEGLSPLDEERAESMASEGGRSAQALDAEQVPTSLVQERVWASWWPLVPLGVAAALLAWFGVRRPNRR